MLCIQGNPPAFDGWYHGEPDSSPSGADCGLISFKDLSTVWFDMPCDLDIIPEPGYGPLGSMPAVFPTRDFEG